MTEFELAKRYIQMLVSSHSLELNEENIPNGRRANEQRVYAQTALTCLTLLLQDFERGEHLR